MERHWYYVLLVVAAIAISYFDRQTLSVAAAPGSGIIAGMSERMTKRTYEVNFALDLMRKDLAYFQTAAKAFGVSLSSAANAEQLFREAQQQGRGLQDMAAVVEVVGAAKP